MLLYHSELESSLIVIPVALYESPIDHLAEVFQILGSCVAVINVVGVLPDINSQQRLVAISKRIAGIRSVEDRDVTVLLCKPGPSRAEVCDCLS